jgi:prepilin-type N-terminal cleavage/methylation domain-containing protein
MVLKESDRQRGVTLIELIMALSLSALVVGMAMGLFRDVGFAARLGAGRRDAGTQAQALFASLADNLMTGGGIMRLAPDRLELLNLRNRRIEYHWQDSTLTANGKTWAFRLASLEAVPSGPRRPDWKAFSGSLPWDLDSLDGNRDGAIDFEELDRDRNGELDPEESRYIATIRLTLTTVYRGVTAVQTCVVHPRNRVPAAIGQTAEEVLGSGGIPDP